MTCDVCAKTGIPDDELVQFEDKNICPDCKDGFFQRLREGVTPPKAVGMKRRIAVVSLHLAWTVFTAYVVLLAIHIAIILGLKQFGTPQQESLKFAGGFAWVLALFVLDPVVSLCAAILTVRLAARQLGIRPEAALRPLAPPLLIILAATGIPAAMVCAALVLAMFIGFLLALFLTPYFLTLIFALLYLLYLKWRAR